MTWPDQPQPETKSPLRSRQHHQARENDPRAGQGAGGDLIASMPWSVRSRLRMNDNEKRKESKMNSTPEAIRAMTPAKKSPWYSVEIDRRRRVGISSQIFDRINFEAARLRVEHDPAGNRVVFVEDPMGEPVVDGVLQIPASVLERLPATAFRSYFPEDLSDGRGFIARYDRAPGDFGPLYGQPYHGVIRSARTGVYLRTGQGAAFA